MARPEMPLRFDHQAILLLLGPTSVDLDPCGLKPGDARPKVQCNASAEACMFVVPTGMASWDQNSLQGIKLKGSGSIISMALHSFPCSFASPSHPLYQLLSHECSWEVLSPADRHHWNGVSIPWGCQQSFEAMGSLCGRSKWVVRDSSGSL